MSSQYLWICRGRNQRVHHAVIKIAGFDVAKQACHDFMKAGQSKFDKMQILIGSQSNASDTQNWDKKQILRDGPDNCIPSIATCDQKLLSLDWWWVGGWVKFLHIERKKTIVVHSHPPSHYKRKHAPGWQVVVLTALWKKQT